MLSSQYNIIYIHNKVMKIGIFSFSMYVFPICFNCSALKSYFGTGVRSWFCFINPCPRDDKAGVSWNFISAVLVDLVKIALQWCEMSVFCGN